MNKQIWIQLLAFVFCASVAVAEKATESRRQMVAAPDRYWDNPSSTCTACEEDPDEHAGQVCGEAETEVMCKCIAQGGSQNGQEVDARILTGPNNDPEFCKPLYRQNL